MEAHHPGQLRVWWQWKIVDRQNESVVTTAWPWTLSCAQMILPRWNSNISWNAYSMTDTLESSPYYGTHAEHVITSVQAISYNCYSVVLIPVQMSAFWLPSIMWHILSHKSGVRWRNGLPNIFCVATENTIQGGSPYPIGWSAAVSPSGWPVHCPRLAIFDFNIAGTDCEPCPVHLKVMAGMEWWGAQDHLLWVMGCLQP